MNTTTPRLFIAATEQNVGKTTTCLGLYAALRPTLSKIGFIKPVGQRFVEVDGKRIDEDSVLIQQTFNTDIPIEDMSPIAVEPDFTRRYINHANHESLVRRIQHSFDRSAWEKDFVIIEGTGHAGVGSVFDLSNAKVASLLHSKVVLVTPGGIGRPIDEAVLNKALFDREGVEFLGVVINKVRAEKFEQTLEFGRKGLARLGIELLGVIPEEPILQKPTLREICERLHGNFIVGENFGRLPASNIVVAAMSSSNLRKDLRPGSLVITPGDREDIILACASAQLEGSPVVGMVLSEGLQPHETVLNMIRSTGLPIITCELDAFTIASRIHSMTIKTFPGDSQKIDLIQDIIAKNLDIVRIRELLGLP